MRGAKYRRLLSSVAGVALTLASSRKRWTGELPAKRAVGYDAAGQPYDETGHRIRKHKEPPSLDKAITNIFTGVGFLFVAFSVMKFAPGGRMWWFWMLIPAFTMLGGGVAEYVRVKQSRGEESKTARPSNPDH